MGKNAYGDMGRVDMCNEAGMEIHEVDTQQAAAAGRNAGAIGEIGAGSGSSIDDTKGKPRRNRSETRGLLRLQKPGTSTGRTERTGEQERDMGHRCNEAAGTREQLGYILLYYRVGTTMSAAEHRIIGKETQRQHNRCRRIY